jgi:hypothetical protein
MEGIKDKKDIILPSLYQFYGQAENINTLIPIISGYSQLSIRVLDWFVTNYAKKHNVIYILPSGNHFNVHLSYKSQLKGYKKKMFDPFCRKKRIPFYYGDNKCIITTIGQLNFFRWAIENNILNYVIDNIESITGDMNADVDTPTSSERKANSLPLMIDLES